MPTTTGNAPQLLWPGIKAIIYDDRDLGGVKPEWEAIFKRETSDKAYERYIGYSSFGLVPTKSEGAPAQSDEAMQTVSTDLVNVTRALSFIITLEAAINNQYFDVASRLTMCAKHSFRETKQWLAFDVLNNGFDGTNYPIGDGQALFSSSHPRRASGGNYSNVMTVAAALSETALENLVIQIRKATNSRNLFAALKPQTLVVPVDRMFDAERILKSLYTPTSANNAVNVVRGQFPGGMVASEYLTNTGYWFVTTNIQTPGLVYQERKPLEFDMHNDALTNNSVHVAYEMYTFGAVDPLAIYGVNPS